MVYDISTCPSSVYFDSGYYWDYSLDSGYVLLAVRYALCLRLLADPCILLPTTLSRRFTLSFLIRYLISTVDPDVIVSVRCCPLGAYEEAAQVFTKQRQRQFASCLSCPQIPFDSYHTQAIAHRFSSTLAVFQHHVLISRPFQGPSSTCIPNSRLFLELQIDA